jgi:hypothetical protein
MESTMRPLAWTAIVTISFFLMGTMILMRGTSAQPNDYACNDGPTNGCGVTINCANSPGTCEDGVTPYVGYAQVGNYNWTCGPASEENCNNSEFLVECVYTYYANVNLGRCVNEIFGCEDSITTGEGCDGAGPGE